MKNTLYGVLVSISLAISPLTSHAQTPQDAVKFMQSQWAINNNYQLEGDEQEEAFIKLIEAADAYAGEYPSDASVLMTWSSISLQPS